MTPAEPLILDIHRFALDDGPGIRSTVFFKGCPLACVWCHNPEAIHRWQELAFYPERCVRCGECVRACREEAISLEREPRIDRDTCTVCGDCVETCPSTALRLLGRRYRVEELAGTLLRDRIFYDASGGGVTFSGGEPTMHMAFLGQVLEALHAAGIHTAVQTCGLFDLETFVRQVLPYTDRIYFDLKLFDPAEHFRYTGARNERILENFRQLSRIAHDKIEPRAPLIPEVTDRPANLRAIDAFVSDCGYAGCRRLPYNPVGALKRGAIGGPAL